MTPHSMPEQKRKFLFLCRHGNTFEKGQPSYIVGCHEDLPLTQVGERQAEELGEILAEFFKHINQIDCGTPGITIRSGTLARTRRYAEILSKKISLEGVALKVEEDARLTELDYGSWSGKTAQELEQNGWKEALKSWDEAAIWPIDAQFKPAEGQVELDIRQLLGEQTASNSSALFVTSNGRLKFFHRVIGSPSSPKMSTGACSLVEFCENSWKIVFWNLKSAELKSALTNVIRAL